MKPPERQSTIAMDGWRQGIIEKTSQNR